MVRATSIEKWTLTLFPLSPDQARLSMCTVIDGKADRDHISMMNKSKNTCTSCARNDKLCSDIILNPIIISTSDPMTPASVMLGRTAFTGVSCLKLSRLLCAITLTTKQTVHGTVKASVTMHQKETSVQKHVFRNGVHLGVGVGEEGLEAGEEILLMNGDIISLFGPAFFAYRIDLSWS